MVYRTTDFKTNEYSGLKGGEKYEESEENPMIGYRGASRYITRHREVFQLEMAAIKRVREQYKNLWVMIPFVRTRRRRWPDVKKALEELGLKRSAGVQALDDGARFRPTSSSWTSSSTWASTASPSARTT